MHFWTSSIRNRFLTFFTIIGIVILAVVTAGHFRVTASIDELRRVSTQEVQHERGVNAMVTGFKKQVQEWKNVLLRGADTAQREKYWGKFQAEELAIQQQGKALLSSMAANEARQLVEDFLRAHQEMGVAYRTGLQSFVDAGFDAATGDKAVKGIDRAPTELLEEAASKSAADAQSATAEALEQGTAAVNAAWLTTLLTLVLGILLSGYFLKRYVVTPVGKVVAGMNRLAAGDFQVEITLQQEDEIGQLAQSVRRVRDDMGEVLRSIVGMVEDLDRSGASLSQLASQNRVDLSTQQDGTSQVATATEELAATAREVANGAAGAADAASQAERSTSGGLKVVQTAISSIRHLETDVSKVSQVLQDLAAHSGAIGNVLNVIRGIAEQTNLLALNAAIEAARAGDQGRGFAVVADEVRSLAQRTQESTQEIQLTIEQLQEGATAAVQAMEHGQGRVTEGVSRTEEVVQALNDIAGAVTTIVDMTAQIATAAEEQGVVAGDVSRNVSQIDQSSRDLVAAADSAAETSLSIAALASGLAKTVSRFRV
ncbi:MAG TPA: methyl-accepting chemotaxis protein [Gammaproteobacteria bacterium]|nr:methyl-accepting chemotaxis protein [Chromatiaceae bacterium]HOP16972.1 methyl-accepting chemotaxis protein [Gammaproteobacteria bacterium]